MPVRTDVRTMLAVATGGLLVAGGLVVIQLREDAPPPEPSAAASSTPAVPVPRFTLPTPTPTPSPAPVPDVAPAPEADPAPDVAAPPEDDEAPTPVRARSGMSADRHTAPAPEPAEHASDDDEQDTGGDRADRGEAAREQAERDRDAAQERAAQERTAGRVARAAAAGDSDSSSDSGSDSDSDSGGTVLALRADSADRGDAAALTATGDRGDRQSLLRRAAERLRDRVDRTCGLLRLIC